MNAGVLIVDDDAHFRQTAAALLRRHGLKPAGCAADSGNGMRMVEQDTFAAALVDVNLPDGDGLALAARMRGHQPELQVVLTSSDSDAVTDSEAFEAGAAAFVSKTDLLAVDLARLLDDPGRS